MNTKWLLYLIILRNRSAYLLLFALAIGTVLLLNKPASAQWSSDLLLNPGEFGTTSDNNSKCIASNGNDVHVVWYGQGPQSNAIYYKRATGCSTNWEPEQILRSGTTSAYTPSIAVSGLDVHVVWQDWQTGRPQIFYSRSVDGGTTWASPVQLTNTPGEASRPAIAVDGQLVHVAYEDTRFGALKSEIFDVSSTNAGAPLSWSIPVRVSHSNPAKALYPSVAISGSDVHVAWEDYRNGPGNTVIYYAYNNGGAWMGERQISNGNSFSYQPCIAASGTKVHLVWGDQILGHRDIFYNHSDDAGGTWLAADVPLTNKPADSWNPSVAVSGDDVHVVWYDLRYMISGHEICYKRSADDGGSWTLDERITNDPANSYYPSVSTSNSVVHVLWTDDRNGGMPKLYYKRNPPAVPLSDVWIMRTPLDDGAEPLGLGQGYDANNSTTIPWYSPAIWNTRGSDAGTGMAHQNPAIGLANTLRVMLRNRGCVASDSGHLYAYLSPIGTYAPLVPSPAGIFPNNPGSSDGGWTNVNSAGYVNTPSIPPGGSVIINIPWTPTSAGHCCFYVRYEEILTTDRIKAEGVSAIDNVIADNNLGHRNVDIVDSTFHIGSFWIRNRDSANRAIDLHFTINPATKLLTPMSDLAISLRLPSALYQGWSKAGSKGVGIKVGTDSSIHLTGSTEASILGLPLGPTATGQVAFRFDSLSTETGETLRIQVAQFTNQGDTSKPRLDDGLTWEIHPSRIAVTKHPNGGDTIASERPTLRPMHVQTYAIYVSNGNQQRAAIDRVIVGVEGLATILAIGPPQDSQKTCISLARDRTGRHYVYQCASDDQVRLYAGEAFRPIYLTVATPDTGNVWINFSTLDQKGDTITNGRAFLTDALTSQTAGVHDRATFASQSLMSTYPNPMSASGTVKFVLPSMVHGADLSITDATGRDVRTLFAGETFDAGVHQMNFDATNLPSGAYFLTLRADGVQYVSSMRVMH